MSSERKEDLIIASIALLILFVVCMIADWRFGFWRADFGPEWFSYEVSGVVLFGGSALVYPLKVNVTTALIVVAPILFYGVLRALGVVKRLFRFEGSLSKLIPEETKH